ncbi:hypothetical protein [Actinopolymorpha sp. B9G3]|uniref:hypothetical protein n=1 Tax=Actinopolymorpha sp. B9G3 TaxID=3158970 RepID=UPI0032D8E168
MTYSKAFFDLQWRFAIRIASLSGLPLEQALLDCTNLYIRFGLGRDFDPRHPVWQAYLVGVESEADGGEWTYRFALSRPREVEVPALVGRFGCFGYAQLGDDRIRLRFHNAEPPGRSPLSRDRLPARHAELRALFRHVHAHAETSARVAGVSWLYNLAAYRRCFPAAYVETAKPAGPRFRNMPLWGQFLDRHGEVRPDAAATFLERLDRQADMRDIASCFPMQPLAVEAPVSVFYDFHQL